jgi:thiamine kinase-like enzyme
MTKIKKSGLNQYFNDIVLRYCRQEDIQKIFGIENSTDISYSFLAQGEYNINYLLRSAHLTAVLRLNSGSQMHLENQIGYEFRTLQVLESTGVTPKPIYCDDSLRISPHGMLIMEYIPGRWLEYRGEYPAAAELFAKIHTIKYFPESGLIAEPMPARAILHECYAMSDVYLKNSQTDRSVKALIEKVRVKVAQRIERYGKHYNHEDLVLNNTEVNSSNFLFDEQTGSLKLVDWEKAIFSIAAQDLSHFLVPTTTLWKTDFRFSALEIKRFIQIYCQKSGYDPNEIQQQMKIYFPLTCLRGVTWCSMAYVEYLQPDRLIKNEYTFNKIKMYTTEDFIKNIFADLLDD